MIFKTTKELINEIDEFLDAASQGALVFRSGVKNYLEGDLENFQANLSAIDKTESRADKLRRNAENNLYRHSLLPEQRGDVLSLLETIDEVIDAEKETLFQFDIEAPNIPDELNQKYINLTESACNSVESLVKATRTFFRDPNSIKDHLHKVYFYEKEADKIADSLKRFIFKEMDLDLSEKVHLRYFAGQIDLIADKAENVADRLSIYAIKQSI